MSSLRLRRSGEGQAAVRAAAVALKAGVSIREIDVKELQKTVYPLKEA